MYRVKDFGFKCGFVKIEMKSKWGRVYGRFTELVFQAIVAAISLLR